jgi:hypothetical protein
MVMNSGIANIAVMIRRDREIMVSVPILSARRSVQQQYSVFYSPEVEVHWPLFKSPYGYDICKHGGVHTEGHHSSDIHEPDFLLA